jgi:two-component system, NtrC family, response regulator AtoC
MQELDRMFRTPHAAEDDLATRTTGHDGSSPWMEPDCMDGAGVGVLVVPERMWEPHGRGIVARIRQSRPETSVMVLDGNPSGDGRVRLVRQGGKAFDDAMDSKVGASSESSLCDSNLRANEDVLCGMVPPGVAIIGTSAATRRTLDALKRVARSKCNPILILGETGTGKELAARAVHAWRIGGDEPFVAVNCAALNAGLLESELFGHVKGAFTGADGNRKGLFEAAGEGTIFLDEISEMPLELQAKLLRVLQERRFRKIGDTKEMPCRATVIVASNRDLLAEAGEGRFRKDLYYRLAVLPISLAPLRASDRREDIPVLARHFAKTSEMARESGGRRLSRAALSKLFAWEWPGNVRELRNVIDRALILSEEDQIGPGDIHLDGAPTPCCEKDTSPDTTRRRASEKEFSLETAEREFILRALKETGWQRTRAAGLLGITRATLHAKLKRYDIQPPSEAVAAKTA